MGLRDRLSAVKLAGPILPTNEFFEKTTCKRTLSPSEIKLRKDFDFAGKQKVGTHTFRTVFQKDPIPNSPDLLELPLRSFS
ncbi:hypothetical protein DLM75_15910 [Leptospira stimsonii]|uniref:Uncharacterized protein n=1 Tax=Leptospira stimsonii TaxID=2202203 RepID=A0A396Z5A4_9LEPT|nr:hypothetical protein DLM75_15910 [Leptospira stimsonii]